MNDLTIVIGIPTFKRPEGLKHLLNSIAKQNIDCKFSVLVADNEGDNGVGLATVEQVRAEGYPYPLSAIPVNDRGISQVRNALMDEAFGRMGAEMLAMVDDDEWVEPQWLSSLIKVQKLTNADVVGGSVDPEFELTPPSWVKGLGIYYRIQRNTSGLVSIVEGTTNVLIHRKVYDTTPIERFDPFYSLVGGGDKEFFTRLKRRGATFAFAHEAKSYEIFGASRMTKKWAIERASRIGAADSRAFIQKKPTFLEWCKELSKVVGAIAVSMISYVLMYTKPHKQMKARLKIARQMGKIGAFFGKQKQVYREVHGK